MWPVFVDEVLQSVQKTASWQTRRKRSRSGEAGLVDDLQPLAQGKQQTGILAEIATLGGATNLVNASAWLGNVTWNLLAGTNQIRNLHATDPLSIQLPTTTGLSASAAMRTPRSRPTTHRRGPDKLLHKSRSHRHHRGSHQRV